MHNNLSITFFGAPCKCNTSVCMQTSQIGSVAFNAQKTGHVKSFTASPVFPRLCDQGKLNIGIYTNYDNIVINSKILNF